MFGRAAACSIAALFLVSPAFSGGEPDAFTDLRPPAPSVVIELRPGQGPIEISKQSSDLTSDQVQNAHAPDHVGALDPAQDFTTSLSVSGPAIQAPASSEPFGLNAIPVASGDVLTKWNGVEADIDAENDILSRCRASAELCPVAARNFLTIVAQGRAQTGRARIGIINRAINLAIRPMSDLAQWGVIDRWSAPLVTLTTGRGDCEDYAIAKYVALTQAGVAAEDVRLVIVRDLAAGEDHAVVAARLNGDWIILDNRWLTLVEGSEMRRTVPLFVLDQTGVKQFALTPTPDTHRVSAPREGAASPAAL
jgi:predicted transglutaminase-like cysteine proteinase